MLEFMIFLAIAGIILLVVIAAAIFIIGMIYAIFKGLHDDYVENVKTQKWNLNPKYSKNSSLYGSYFFMQ